MNDRRRTFWTTYRIHSGHKWVAMDWTTSAVVAHGWARTKGAAQDAARKFSRSQKHESVNRV
jgi:hypothetical protein